MSTLLALALATTAHAQEKEAPKFPSVKVTGVLFLRYGIELTDGSDYANAFDLDRAYLRADAKLSPRVSTRLTLDADHMRPMVMASGEEVTYDTRYRVFVKHAYVEVKDLGPLRLRLGTVPTPYTSWYDDLWGNRYILESFAREWRVLDTADLGVSLLGNHGDGLVDWNVAVINGEGYSRIEIDAGKAAQARVTIDPLAKVKDRELPITGFASISGNPSTVGEPTFTWGGGAGFQMPRLFVWAEVLGTTTAGVDGFGYSGTLNPRLPKYAGIIARYDHWDPDTSVDGDAGNVLLAGIDKDFFERVSVAVMYEREWSDTTPDAPEHGIVVHGQAGF